MIILSGNSLNEKHRELNSKVNEAATHGVPFENVKSRLEKTDIDRLFKIDLANKYKNVDYIIEMLKCGDTVYITRALKCTWLYNEEFSHIINPDYLDQHIFPEMSSKIKYMFLKVTAQHMTNSDRAALYFTYCLKISAPNIALKFLLYTSEAFKLEVIKAGSLYISDADMINVIGNSFTLATAALDKLESYNVCQYLKSLNYLYSLSEDGYLDLVEKYYLKHSKWRNEHRLGLRISKHIIKKHKDRLFCHTSFYLSMLNKKITVKYSMVDDVKKYVLNLLSPNCSEFWHFYSQYEYILEVIPFSERLQYLKKIFNEHYPNEKFDMNIQFYHTGLYKLMTKAERESWALKHVEEGLEHFGHGQDFKWYKFVSFKKAYEPIKKYILVASNADVRTLVINTLVSSAESNRDLEILFNYYYQRFVNEKKPNKNIFVDKVFKIHNCYNFDDDCWNAFDKILHSMDVYDVLNAYSCKSEYKLVAIIYSIIHEKELHEALKSHINDGINLYEFKQQTDKLTEEKVELVYQYIIHYYLEKINSFNINNYNDDVKYGVRKYIHSLLELMLKYNKPKTDIPDIVSKLVALDEEEYKYNSMLIQDETPNHPITQHVLIKDLKIDASLVISKIPVLKQELINNIINLSVLLKKIKMYFSTDIALKFIELYKELLALDEIKDKISDAAVYGILHLEEKDNKVDFVEKYVPTEPKIDHVNIERKLLNIRTALCKFMWVSRPALPFSTVQKYIIGDYLKFCLPMFQSYRANLQPAKFVEFVTFLLKSPASIQKHGIRMAFGCFSIKDLKATVSDIWKKTKNVSLRLVMYKAVLDKIIAIPDEPSQKELFETFKTFTLDVREDDDNELFTVMISNSLPRHIMGEHILNAWQVLNTLPNKPIIITRQANVIKRMGNHIGLMQQDIIESIVCEHIKLMLEEEEGIKVKNESHINDLSNAKWYLTAIYLMHLPSNDSLEQKLKIVEKIVTECLRLWNYSDNHVYVVRPFLLDFISNLQNHIRYSDTTYCLNGIVILEHVLKLLQDALPLVEIYDTVWYIRLSVILANTIADGRRLIAERGDEDWTLIFTESVSKFANEFTSLVNEFMGRDDYFTSAISVIRQILTRQIINIFEYSLFGKWPSEKDHGTELILIEICSKLIETEKIECYKMALELWPVSYKSQNCMYFINKLKTSDNAEINYLLYRKFVTENNYDSTPFS